MGQKKASEGQQEDEMAQRHDGELEKGTEKRKNIGAVQSHRKEEKHIYSWPGNRSGAIADDTHRESCPAFHCFCPYRNRQRDYEQYNECRGWGECRE